MKYRVIRIDSGIGINETPITDWDHDEQRARRTARELADEHVGAKFAVRDSEGLTAGEFVSYERERA